MPNIKSAIKRDAISKARRLRNQSNKSRLNTARKAFLAALEGDEAGRQAALNTFYSEIDKAAKKGAIAKNGASRRKSRAAALLAAKSAAKA